MHHKPEKSEINPVREATSRPWFIASIAITVFLVGLLVWHLVFSFNLLTSFKEREFVIERSSWQLLLYAETMHMAALVSATSGDMRWQQTYQETKPKLENVLQQIPELVQSREIKQIAQEIEVRLENLSQMEEQAFELTSRGQRSEAFEILSSWSYTKNKMEFSSKAQSLVDLIQERLEEKTSFDTTRTVLAIVTACLLLLALSWYISIRIWRLQIQKKQEAEEKVSLLLHNSGQGFMMIDQDLQVDPNYSQECLNIFQSDVAGARLQDLLFEAEGYQKDHFAKSLKQLLAQDDEYLQETIISLLPEQFQIGDRHVQVQYKLLAQKQIILIITDITEKVDLEKEVEEEHKRLALVVNALLHKNDVLSIVQEFETFLEREAEWVLSRDQEALNKLNIIYRRIHTFKGLLQQYEFIHSPYTLHRIEEGLSEAINNHRQPSIPEIRDLLCSTELKQSLEKDKDILRAELGGDLFAEQVTVDVSLERLLNLNHLAEQLLPKCSGLPDLEPKCRELLQEMKYARYQNMKSLLGKYAKFVQQTASNLEKWIYALQIQGADLYVDPGHYEPFMNSLVHVFRNSLAHGIEEPDLRAAEGKDEQGLIYCSLEQDQQYVLLRIGDDGRGIDQEALIKKAVQTGRYSEQDLQAWSEQDLLSLVLEDHISTAGQAGQIAGRGVGLSAVREEISKLQGWIEIVSRAQEGTEFLFYLPRDEYILE